MNKFSNGHKNGKGKEYDNRGLLIFEGEYINGTRNGKGKEYFDNGKLKFEGEYHYGLRNGKGKEYFKNGELKFEGEYNFHSFCPLDRFLLIFIFSFFKIIIKIIKIISLWKNV